MNAAGVTGAAVLEVDDLEVSYGPVRAVRGVTLSVAAGELVALLGPNGAGKSSTLRAISRLEPSRGTIRFDGADIGRRTPEQLARRGLLHVPEGRRIIPTLTVEENLLVAQVAARGRTGASLDEVYDLFPMLAGIRTRGGWALSGGEQQMLAVGRALVGGPRLLLLDEPSLGLAPAVVQAVFAALAEIRSRVPILLVEQNTAVALRIADRGVVLAQGQIVLEGTPAELTEHEDLLDSYLGRRHAEH